MATMVDRSSNRGCQRGVWRTRVESTTICAGSPSAQRDLYLEINRLTRADGVDFWNTEKPWP
jgi:hypothetical protein